MLGNGRSYAERQATALRRAREQEKRERERIAKDQERQAQVSRAAAQARARYEHAQEGLERLRDHERHYANTILLLGYGGFFALWATLSGSMPKGLFGVSGLLIAISLVLFIGFELAKTAATSLGVSFGQKHRLDENATIGRCNENLDKVNAWWLPIFLTSVVTGLSAGGILIWFYAINALSGSWQ